MKYLSARRSDWAVPHAALRTLRQATAQGADTEAPRSVHETLGRSGQPLESGVRAGFEARMGQDFSHVRVHTDAPAARSARAVGALAYTVGRDVVFGREKYDPHSSAGQRLLAHELTHVTQQQGATARGGCPLRINSAGEAEARQAEHVAGHVSTLTNVAASLQRAPDPADVKEFDKQIAELRKLEVVKKLSGNSKQELKEIIDIARKRDNPGYYSDKLHTLFTTAEQPEDQQASVMSAKIKDSADKEKVRVGGQSQDVTNREETISKTHKFKKARGLQNSTFEVDARDVTDIAVRAKVHLVQKGKGTSVDVDNVKLLRDAIEKRGSTLGYSLDLEFVDKSDTDVFTVDVDTSQWTVSGNWAGNDVDLVHELHHLLGLEQDRYNYIESHSGNEQMKIPDRLHWFREEFKKTIDNDEESIMQTGERVPLDDDVCRVAGKRGKKEVADCVRTRENAREARLKPGVDQALAWLTKASATPPASSEALAKQVFIAPPDAAKRSAAISFIPKYITARNLQLFSQIEDSCQTRNAFARGGARQIGICPAYLGLSAADQSRALLAEAVHLFGIGKMDDADCAAAGCGSVCGNMGNAKAWARFIECSAGTAP